MKKTFTLLLLAALAVGGCKSKTAEAPPSLTPLLAGDWKPVQKGATCNNGGVRFGRNTITVMRKGVAIPAFEIEKTVERGSSLELTLKISDTAKLLAFRKPEQYERANGARIYLSLNTSAHRIEMNDIQLEDPSRGLTALRKHDLEKARQIFTMERCAA